MLLTRGEQQFEIVVNIRFPYVYYPSLVVMGANYDELVDCLLPYLTFFQFSLASPILGWGVHPTAYTVSLILTAEYNWLLTPHSSSLVVFLLYSLLEAPLII